MKLKKIISVLREKKNQKFLLSTHVRPDIDGLASALVLASYLGALKKKVTIFIDDDLPSMYEFLPGSSSVQKFKGQKIDYDVAVILDCGDFNRVGHVRKIINLAKTLINIDHHITNDFFGTVNYVAGKASSTSEIIFDLLTEAGFKFNKEIAMLLYAGILTDTGGFRYDNTTSRVHSIVSQLLRFKFSTSKLYNKIYESVPLDNIKLFTKVVNKFEVSHDGRVVCVELSQKILNKFSDDFDLRDKIFSFLRAIKGVEVIIILTESKKGLTRVNFRAQGNVDVSSLAANFGGGGHQKASGCAINSDIRTAKQKILSQIGSILK